MVLSSLHVSSSPILVVAFHLSVCNIVPSFSRVSGFPCDMFITIVIANCLVFFVFQGIVIFRGSNRASLHYSIPKDMLGSDRYMLNKADWDCPKVINVSLLYVTKHNFYSWRVFCSKNCAYINFCLSIYLYIHMLLFITSMLNFSLFCYI